MQQPWPLLQSRVKSTTMESLLRQVDWNPWFVKEFVTFSSQRYSIGALELWHCLYIHLRKTGHTQTAFAVVLEQRGVCQIHEFLAWQIISLTI